MIYRFCNLVEEKLGSDFRCVFEHAVEIMAALLCFVFFALEIVSAIAIPIGAIVFENAALLWLFVPLLILVFCTILTASWLDLI